jgi:ATP-dependent helicase STH1/SNF2
MQTLRAQIQAFKYISKGLPVPPEHQAAMHGPRALAELQHQSQPHGVHDKIVDGAARLHHAAAPAASAPAPASDAVKTEDEPGELDAASLPTGPFLEDDARSGIYPYNAYVHPFTHLRRAPGMDPAAFASRMQRLLVPSVMPAGLDAHQLLAERARYVDARVQRRIDELEALPATLGEGGGLDDTGAPPPPADDPNAAPEASALAALAFPSAAAHGKLRALIELKALRVLDKQRELRALVAERLTHGTLLPLNRAEFRRVRRPTGRDARTTEQLERKQRLDRERRAKQKHVEQLGLICAHGREVLAASRAAQDRALRVGKAVLAFHAHDEEAYMKLIDTAKDTRITHLLKQTDSYLEGLAQAVMAQQAEGGVVVSGPIDADTNEATFGAQVADYDEPATDGKKVDYYAVAHRIKETVKQPSILVGGTLKEYQIKGLQWMVSLYNNKLNGILADEMVRFP